MSLAIYTGFPALRYMASKRLEQLSKRIEQHFNAEVVILNSGIAPASVDAFNQLIDKLASRTKRKEKRLVLVLKTYGGQLDMALNIIDTIRRYFEHVIIIVPEVAVSAGTLIALSANELYATKLTAFGSLDIQLQQGNGESCSLSALNARVEKGKKMIAADSGGNNPLMMQERDVITRIEIWHKLIEENYWQEQVRISLLGYLKKYMYPNYDSLSSELKTKIDAIPKILTDELALIQSGTFFHNHYIPIEKLHQMGVDIKDYHLEHNKISKAIDEFNQLASEYHHVQINPPAACLYCRLVTDVPLLQAQVNDAKT